MLSCDKEQEYLSLNNKAFDSIINKMRLEAVLDGCFKVSEVKGADLHIPDMQIAQGHAAIAVCVDCDNK